jgi:CHAT domain-containing protein
LELTSLIQSERQQLAMAASRRWYLDSYLGLGTQFRQAAEPIYRAVLRWKGAIWTRQREGHAVADRPELLPAFKNLQSVATRLSKLALNTPDPKDLETWRRQLEELTRQKEALEQELARRSEAFRASPPEIMLQDLKASLPAHFALVDYLVYRHDTPPPKDKPGALSCEQRLVAFVVRPGREVTLVPLGSGKAVADAVDQWRQSYGRTVEGQRAAQRLRQQVWEPLKKHLAGARAVLVSPDGPLARFPFAALPGENPGEYLLQEQALAVLPVPQALPTLIRETEGPKPDRNLLLVGDVDYDAPPSQSPGTRSNATFARPAARGPQWRSFDRLDATLGELSTIQTMYQDRFVAEGLTRLRGAEASKARFAREAPRHKYLHLATHGFFSPPGLVSAFTSSEGPASLSSRGLEPQQAIAGFAPGLLSGLALAGANREPTEDEDDGILTAEEVQNLDLRGVRLAVLSACETGLGEVAGGEGLLGLQRAFQVAGARTVIASLWKVDDVQTRALMERFYRNLWEKNMTTAGALREAQLWMLQEGARGSERLRPKDAAEPATLSPYYWASFVLSGDWR